MRDPDKPLGDAGLTGEQETSTRLGERNKSSIYLGRYYDAEKEDAASEIQYGGERHILMFGPNGSGKGTRFLVPNLLRGLREQSVIVIDPKGELAAITADARRAMGHKVFFLNPFGVLGLKSTPFSPLARLDPDSPTFIDDASAISEALIQEDSKDPHWSQSARGLVTGLIMWEVIEARREKREPVLINTRRMLTEPEEKAVRQDSAGQLQRIPVKGLRATAGFACDCGDIGVESLLGRFTREPTDEISSIQSTADTQTRWLLSPPMQDALQASEVVFSDLKKERCTVYIILPAERLRTHSVWLRLVIVSALHSLYRPGGLRTLMLIDEAAALGHLGALEDAFGLVRGYRVQIAAIFQDLAQLKALYKERWETFVANAGAVFGFAPNDLTTAEWMSKRSGQTTVVVKGISDNSGTSIGQQTSASQGKGSNLQQMARPLFLPHELIGLDEGKALLWLANLSKTIPIFAPAYWKIRECQPLSAPNPYYQPDG